MVQINLLPDVKSEYLHARQQKHTFVVAAILVSVISMVILALVYMYVQIVQPRHMVNLQNDIDSNVSKAKQIPNAVEMVTVQGALTSLPGLEDNKQLTSRLFGLITSFTPVNVAYNEITLDTTANTLSLRGSTTDYEQANVLANNLKSAELTYVQNDAKSTLKPFTQVVFTNLGKAEQSQDVNSVSFQVDMQYDSTLFNQVISKPQLSVKADSKDLLIPSDKPFGEGGGQ